MLFIALLTRRSSLNVSSMFGLFPTWRISANNDLNCEAPEKRDSQELIALDGLQHSACLCFSFAKADCSGYANSSDQTT